MNRKLISSLVAAGVAVATIGAARADTAYTATFTTSITYSNVGSGPASVQVTYYPEGSSSSIPVTLPSLPVNASSSIFAGNVATLPSGFKGSAILSSDQPVAATLVQISTGTDTLVKNRPLANGFAAGSSNVLLATVLKDRFDSTSRFAVQNAGAAAAGWTIKFFNADAGGALVHTINEASVPVGAAKYYDLGEITQIPSNFNGSATIEAPGGSVVATVLELSTSGVNASAFEGVTGGATTLFMPSALCNAFGGQNTAYAIQNTSASTANVTVTYSNGGTQSASIGSGAKASFLACNATGASMSGFSGSATITSNQSIVGIMKVYGVGLYAAALGATDGAAKIVLPYVRWSESQFSPGGRQRAFIAVQNVGGALNAGDVTIQFLDRNGAQVGSTVSLGALSTGAKQSVNPSNAGAAAAEFGYLSDGTIGGGAIIQGPAGSKLVAVVRIVSSINPATGEIVGEDYNGIPVQ